MQSLAMSVPPSRCVHGGARALASRVGAQAGARHAFSQLTNKLSRRLQNKLQGPAGIVDTGSGAPPRKPPVPPKATADFGDGGSEDKGRWIRFKGWEDRVAADPQFAYKVLVEQVIGVGAAVIGDMSTRPNWGLNELDFVFSTLVVGSLMNFALMYLLAPAGAKTGATSRNLITKMFDERTLTNWGAPGGHIFEAGYSLKGRVINLLFKSFTFGFIGFWAGIVGTSMSNGLICLRQATDKSFVPQNKNPPIVLNSLAWTLHMGLSSNIRYQALNGLDAVMIKVLPAAVFRAIVVIVRTLNNAVGGVSFVTCARIVGSQPTIESPVEA